tara:strand:- start:9921 stop:10736 length:816 start_codon:yes stop_codon:yes gene_type:complete
MQTWYNLKTINNATSIDILDEIGLWGVNASDFINDVKNAGDVSEINISINSPGGNVFDGLAIYNYLKSHKAKVNVDVLALAASAASVIAMAGDNVTMPEDAFLMIHAPYTASVGNADEMRKTAEVLDKIQDTLVNIYETKTGLDRELISEMVATETWISGSDSVEMGFANKVTEQAIAALAKGFEKNFKAVPQALTGKRLEVSNITNIRDFEKALRDLGLSKKDAVALASVKLDILGELEQKAKADYSAKNNKAASNLLDFLATTKSKKGN